MNRNNNHILIAVIAIVFCILFLMFPILGVLMLCILLVVIRPILSGNNHGNDGVNLLAGMENDVEEQQRRAALAEAKIFLAPYRDIWRDLRLSNKYCSLTLDKDGVTIKCIEKVKPYRKFQVVESNIHTYRELWNLFCIYFSYNKSYDGVVEDCMRYHVSIMESQNSTSNQNLSAKGQQTQNTARNTIALSPQEKTDVNNCSEIELTELPGISIVLAKKIIKKREEINGFKSIEDFFVFLKLKPHMENQLRNRIKTEKMRGSIIQKKHSERLIDF